MYTQLDVDLIKKSQGALIGILFEMLNEKNILNKFIGKMRWFVMPIGKSRQKILEIIEREKKIKNFKMQRVDINNGSHAWAFEVDVEIARELKDKRLELGLNFRVFVREDGDQFVREDIDIYGGNPQS